MRHAAALFIGLTVGGCFMRMQATQLAAGHIRPTDMSVNEEMSFPKLNERATAEVENVMTSHAVIRGTKAIALKSGIVHRGVSRTPYTLSIPKAVLIAVGQDSRGTFYQSKEPLLFQTQHGTISVTKRVLLSSKPVTTAIY